jgi:hypothetical protein
MSLFTRGGIREIRRAQSGAPDDRTKSFDHSDLSVAMSIEKRYFTSDFSSRS